MLLICISISILLTVSCVFANDVNNETISVNDMEVQKLQVNSNDVNDTQLGESLSTSVVYFDASATSDGDGSQSKPYKYYKSDRIDYGTTAYFADGVYDITNSSNIYSSSQYRTSFIGQSVDKTILKFNLGNKFAFTVTDNSYFVLSKMTLIDVHISNQANLIANDVMFKNSAGFSQNYAPSLSYSHVTKIYDASYGGVIICDTPSNKLTTLNLTNCRFESNSAVSGGVLATYNTVANIQNCVFYNSSANRFGGAIYSIKSTFNIKDSSFELSHANYGGAIFANSSDFNFEYSQFNLSQAYSFGGVIASFSSNLDLNNVIFNDYASLNDAGGAIYAIGGTLDVLDSTFKNGSADFGGAICNLKCDSTIKNTDFIDNAATYYGGSIYNMYGKVDLNGNNFKNTHASIGGSVFNRFSDSFTLSNNHFTDSTANDGNIVFIDGDSKNVVEMNNNYDSSLKILVYGNVYDIDYHESVPLINYSASLPETMPSFYDARQYGYVTPAKDQIQGGNCWAFSGIATLEACLKKATGIEYDFSEENVKNLMSEYSLFDLDTGANSGGNLYMVIAYLAGWFGPTYDVNDVYDDYSSLSVIYDSVIHVQNVYILPERENFYDNDIIKQAVLQYGAVSIGIDLSQNQGHAVTIVGWDDEFVSNDFLGNKAVGAWIIKNSWGTDWGSEGFGYLSYLQPISFGYTFIFNDDRKYSDIYQYDYAGKSGYHTIPGNQVYLKNKFTAKKDEILSAFSTYFDEPSNYTASVYLNGNLVTSQSGVHEKGYYTIPLEKEVSMKKGDSFEIVVKFSNGGSVIYFPICDADEINRMNYNTGISFYSSNGNDWMDLSKSNSPGVACIKAFTRSNALTDVSIDVDKTGSSSLNSVSVGELINIQLDLPQNYVVDGTQHQLDGIVTFTINGENYFAKVENGKACLNFTFDKEGTYDVKAQFESSRVVSNLIDFTVNVVKTSNAITIQANDVSKFYGGPEKYVATLFEGDNVKSGVNVKISVNGKYYNDVKTDNKGQVSLDFADLPAGVYDVRAQYGQKFVSSKFTVLSTIIANDATHNFLDPYISASFVNTNGEMLSNIEISFNVHDYETNSFLLKLNATTNSLGVATAKTTYYENGTTYFLNSAKHLVSVVNPITHEQKQFVLDITPIDSKIELSVTQSGTDVIIDATLNSGFAFGYVNFIVSGKIYKENIQYRYRLHDGNTYSIAKLILNNLPINDYDVTAIYSGDVNFRVSNSTRDFSVTSNPYIFSSGNFNCYYGNILIGADIKDNNANPISGEVVIAKILNNTYISTTNDYGQAIFYLGDDLEAGTYQVLFEYNGQSLLKYLTVYSTIMDVTSISEYLNSKVGAFFLDSHSNGEPDSKDIKYATNEQVKFIANDKEYLATTDSEGYGSAIVDLPVGTQTVTTVNLANGEKKVSIVTVYKTTPNITITKSKHGALIFFTAKLTQTSAVGNVVFTMGSKKYTSPVIDGEAVLALRNLEEGHYEIYANYIGDSNFNNIVSQKLQFDYVYTNYTLSAPKISKYYGGSDKFIVTLTDFNKPASNQIIYISLNDKIYELKTDNNGVASFDVQLNPGSYGVLCSIEDDEDIKVFSEIDIKSTIIVDGGIGVSYSIMKVEFKDGNGDLIKNKAATFKINSNEYKQTTDILGVATLEPSLDKGNYTVSISNPVTGETKYSTLIITKSVPTMELSTSKVNGINVLKVVLPKTVTGIVDFVFNNGDEYSSDIVNGVSTLELDADALELDPGEYTVDVTYGGNDNYNSVSKSINVKVADVVLSSVLSSSKVTTTYGTSKNILVTLKDSAGNFLVGRTVNVILNNKNYHAVVQGDGKAVIAIPSNLAAKTYTATVTYAGETQILASSIKVNVVVNKATPKLTAAKKTFKVKDKTKKYVVTLKTNKNKVYKNQKVTIKVNGKTYSAKTNSKGQATFKLTKLTKKGKFTATVRYSGNTNYKLVSKNVKITVK